MGRRLCIEEAPHQFTNLYFDSRLVALRKEDNGVRPVGIGETVREGTSSHLPLVDKFNGVF